MQGAVGAAGRAAAGTTPAPWSRRLAWWLALVPAAVALGTLALALLTSERIVGRWIETGAGAAVERQSAALADQIGRVFGRRAAEMQLMARMPLIAGGSDPAAMRAELDLLRRSTPAYTWIGVVDGDGRVLAGSDGLLEGADIGARPVVANGRRGLWFGTAHPAVALGPVMAARGLKAPDSLADIGLPIAGTSRVLAAHVDMAFVERVRERAVGPARDAQDLHLLLADADGSIILGDPQWLPAGAPWVRQAEGQAQTWTVDRPRRREVLIAHQAVVPFDSDLRVSWRVVAVQPLDTALQPLAALRWSSLLWGGAGAALIAVLGAWASRRLARPTLERLEALSSRLEGADAPARGAAAPLGSEFARVLDTLRGDATQAPEAASPAERLLGRLVHDGARLVSVLDHMPTPLALLDRAGRVVLWNAASERLFEVPATAALGRTAGELLGGAAGEAPLAAAVAAAAGAGERASFPARVAVGRAVVDADWTVTPLASARDGALGVLVQAIDRSAERQADERLREQAEGIAAIVHSASDAIIGTDAEGRIELFNPAAERIFGRSAASMLGGPLDALLPAGRGPQHAADLGRFAQSAVTRRRMSTGRVQGHHADGRVLELEASISQARVGGRTLLTAILRDVTDRVAAERAMVQMQLELSELTRRLLEQEGVMMRRMAQTLHDQLGQTLAALRLAIDATAAETGADGASGRAPDSASDSAARQRVVALADRAVAEVRRALVELRPPLLEEQGLVAALRNELDQREPLAGGVDLLLEAETPGRWPADIEYAAFMIAREALANALLHARATLVRVVVDGDAGRLVLEVIDDGIGIAPEHVARAKPGHLGLVGMRERALLIHARLDIAAAPEGGTRVRLEWRAAAEPS